MSITAIIINILALIGLGVAFFKNRKKAVKSLKVAGKSLFKILPMILIIVIIVGLLLGFVPPDQISRYFGEQSGILGILTIGGIGAIIHIPSLVAFPLAASLLESGASVMAAAAFITTLTMIGTVFLPAEIRVLGKELALLRNVLSFIIAIIISILMGLIL